MIAKALYYLVFFLNQYIKSLGGEPEPFVVLGNIASAEIDGDDLEAKNRVVCTLVNTEEEFTKKNYPLFRRENAAGGFDYVQPPLFLNLYVLFSVKTNNDQYYAALEALSEILACFQAKNSFTISNSAFDTENNLNIIFSPQEEADFKLDLELYTMTFEQLNHLWGTLGGKQYPSVMYKVRLVQLEKELTQGRGELIQQITLNANA